MRLLAVLGGRCAAVTQRLAQRFGLAVDEGVIVASAVEGWARPPQPASSLATVTLDDRPEQ